MKKIGLFLSLMLAVLFCAQGLWAASPKKVAVYVEGDVTTGEANVVNSAVMSRVSNSKDYQGFERNREFINALMKEHDYQLSGEVSDKEIRKIGERFGVDYVITVVVTTDDESTYMDARLLNLESGQVIKSVNSDREGTGLKVLKPLANNVAYRLLSQKSR
ncbi:MAG: hypothetical protein J1E38_09890 [Paramuribaculum sp.]|nr:hypothetical protein [Paramuribaculum sp.]